MRIVTIEDIAKQVYYTNKAWCEANGDFSFAATWDEAPQWQRDTNAKGVIFLLQNPDASPSASHDSWMEEKTSQGWVWGPVKDPEANPPTHPAYLPYDELPDHQKIKDYLFRGVVMAMLPFLDENIRKQHVSEEEFKKQPHGILHIVAGEEGWEPTEEEIAELAELFLQAEKDPTGAVIVTRTGIHAQYVTPTGNEEIKVVVTKSEEAIEAEQDVAEEIIASEETRTSE